MRGLSVKVSLIRAIDCYCLKVLWCHTVNISARPIIVFIECCSKECFLSVVTEWLLCLIVLVVHRSDVVDSYHVTGFLIHSGKYICSDSRLQLQVA